MMTHHADYFNAIKTFSLKEGQEELEIRKKTMPNMIHRVSLKDCGLVIKSEDIGNYVRNVVSQQLEKSGLNKIRHSKRWHLG